MTDFWQTRPRKRFGEANGTYGWENTFPKQFYLIYHFTWLTPDKIYFIKKVLKAFSLSTCQKNNNNKKQSSLHLVGTTVWLGWTSQPSGCLIIACIDQSPSSCSLSFLSSAGCHGQAAELGWAFNYGEEANNARPWARTRWKFVSDGLSTEILLRHGALFTAWGIQ